MISTYSPRLVSVTWGPILVGPGYADGTFITAKRRTDSAVLKVGSDGFAARSMNADKSGEITVVLLQTSPTNALLSAQARADELTGAAYYPLLIKDLLGNTYVSAVNAWLKVIAQATMGKEIETREWTWETDFLDMVVGGNPL